LKHVWKKGTDLFAAPDDAQSIIDGKKYIADNKLTRDDVTLGRFDGTIRIRAMKDIEYDLLH